MIVTTRPHAAILAGESVALVEARGLTRREASPADRRVKLLALTTEGERMRDQLESSLLTSSPLVAGLSPAERNALYRLLNKVAHFPGGPSSHAPASQSGGA